VFDVALALLSISTIKICHCTFVYNFYCAYVVEICYDGSKAGVEQGSVLLYLMTMQKWGLKHFV
jgi:hypothetical protein